MCNPTKKLTKTNVRDEGQTDRDSNDYSHDNLHCTLYYHVLCIKPEAHLSVYHSPDVTYM